MTDIEVTLNAWEINYVSVLAVQGESEGRTIIATLVDRTGQTDNTFNAESVDRPIDLTGITARLYCKKADGTATFSDGTITDAGNGVVSFVLPLQATTSAGDVACQIYLTKSDNSVLKTVGLHLNVQESELEGDAESSNDFDSLVKALNAIEQSKADAEQAVADCNEATAAANTATDSANAATSGANTSASNADTKAGLADTAAQNADAKASEAETATANANVAAQSANDAATAANASKEACDTATGAANTAAQNANDKANAADLAATSANTAAATANEKATEADTAATNANTAAQSANASKEACDTATTAADVATTNANTAADRANAAAQQVDDALGGNLDPSIDARIAAQKNQPNGIAGLDENAKVPNAQLPEMDYVPNTEKAVPNGIATLDADGHVPAEQLSIASPNYAGKLIVHVISSDGGSVAGTRVRVRNEQLGSNYAQPIDALGSTTFSLIDNHTYYIVLLDYPSTYYGAAATVTITGGETHEITLTLKNEPDVVGWKINATTGEITYTNGAENFEPMSVTDGVFNPGSWEGHWAADVKPCLLKNMVVQYYLKKTGVFLYDYEHEANGSSSDIRSGADGDVMVEVPRVYYSFKNTTATDGTVYHSFTLAKEPPDGTWSCNAFLSRTGVPQDTIYIPAYKGVIYENKLRSLCDVAPTVSQTIGAFRTAANANGLGYEIRDLVKDRFLAALFVLFFKSTNGQAALGLGRTSGNSAAVNSGTMNDKPLFWGNQTGTDGVKFLGIEHFWGNVFDFLDGIVLALQVYKYEIHGPYNDTGSGYSTGPSAPPNGYINDMAFSNGYGMLPSATVTAEADSKYHDYSYQGSGSEIDVLYVGGGWSDSAGAGPFDWHGSAASYSSASFGASLYATPQN